MDGRARAKIEAEWQGAHPGFLHTGKPLGEKVAGGRMRGEVRQKEKGKRQKCRSTSVPLLPFTFCLLPSSNPSPQPSPLAPQRERESKGYDFVALHSFRCLLAQRLKPVGVFGGTPKTTRETRVPPEADGCVGFCPVSALQEIEMR
ncbi:MAG: hypothetical protein EBS05_09100 [Proteobacteria bacterium]|nr:hypothetical protein [Pseudomonadota bacterium]